MTLDAAGSRDQTLAWKPHKGSGECRSTPHAAACRDSSGHSQQRAYSEGSRWRVITFTCVIQWMSWWRCLHRHAGQLDEKLSGFFLKAWCFDALNTRPLKSHMNKWHAFIFRQKLFSHSVEIFRTFTFFRADFHNCTFLLDAVSQLR